MPRRHAPLALFLSVALLAPAAGAAHEILHAVERGRAVAVRTTFSDGRGLAYAPYEVFSPRDAAYPHQLGKTDRGGWLAFVPDAPGRWRVKVLDAGGHGLDVAVEISPAAGDLAAGGRSWAAFVLRPVAGVAALGALFAAIFAWSRRRAGR